MRMHLCSGFLGTAGDQGRSQKSIRGMVKSNAGGLSMRGVVVLVPRVTCGPIEPEMHRVAMMPPGCQATSALGSSGYPLFLCLTCNALMDVIVTRETAPGP